MEWLWALFSATCTAIVTALTKWSWEVPERWKQQGYLDNGLGTRIVLADNPGSFRGAVWMMKAFSIWSGATALGGIVMTTGWIWKAL